MYGNIKSEKFNKGGIVSKAEKSSQVVGVIFTRVDRRELSLTKNIAVNADPVNLEWVHSKEQDLLIQ